ncbi:MAG: sulfite exporter TauE/SafE family protein, partial [Phycisphaerae bacterium]
EAHAMNIDAIMLLTVAALALSGFVQSVTGFGFGLVSMSLLPLFLSFNDAYTVVAILNLVVCAMTLAGNIRHYRWRQGLGLLIGSCLAVPVGFYALMHVQSDWMLRGLGLLICLFTLSDMLMSKTRPLRVPEKYGWVMGALSGGLSGAFNAGGPPAVIYVYSQSWTKQHTVALLQVVFGTSSVIRLLMVHSSGLLRGELLRVGLLAILPLMLAIHAGTRILHRIPRDRLRLIVFVFLFLIGVKYLLRL